MTRQAAKADEAATSPDRQGGVSRPLRTAHVSKRVSVPGASSSEGQARTHLQRSDGLAIPGPTYAGPPTALR